MSSELKRLRLRLLAGLGAAAIVIGFLWGAFKVGVPYQDPTPEMAAHERFHMRVSDTLQSAGGILLLVSGAIAVLRRFAPKSDA